MTRYDPLVSIHHMLDHAREAVELTRDRSRADLDEDRLLNLALVRLVEVIGEAASRVPLDDDDLERLVLARSPRFQALLDKSRQSIQAGKGLSRAEFWEAVRQRHQQTGQGSASVDTEG